MSCHIPAAGDGAGQAQGVAASCPRDPPCPLLPSALGAGRFCSRWGRAWGLLRAAETSPGLLVDKAPGIFWGFFGFSRRWPGPNIAAGVHMAFSKGWRSERGCFVVVFRLDLSQGDGKKSSERPLCGCANPACKISLKMFLKGTREGPAAGRQRAQRCQLNSSCSKKFTPELPHSARPNCCCLSRPQIHGGEAKGAPQGLWGEPCPMARCWLPWLLHRARCAQRGPAPMGGFWGPWGAEGMARCKRGGRLDCFVN